MVINTRWNYLDKQLTRLSKKLSFVLRHHPDRIGIQLDKFGRADLNDFLKKFNAHYQTPLNKKTIEQIIYQSNKQRFIIEGSTDTVFLLNRLNRQQIRQRPFIMELLIQLQN